jgi:hypothetical protein
MHGGRSNNWYETHQTAFNLWKNPVRIWVRIDPPHPVVNRKRRLNGAVLQMRPEKPRYRVTTGMTR